MPESQGLLEVKYQTYGRHQQQDKGYYRRRQGERFVLLYPKDRGEGGEDKGTGGQTGEVKVKRYVNLPRNLVGNII